jgi:hypothetical protein
MRTKWIFCIRVLGSPRRHYELLISDNVAILLIVWRLERPIARMGRKQNGGISFPDVKSGVEAGGKWRRKSVKNFAGKNVPLSRLEN